ncbi:MAG TPA: hypothetical protein PLN33_09940 [Hyphomonadaceae bacterium]|nr:hypothetical protein [Hyphomonadaceae bacterium]HPN06984.1 hypothetical protein [Hyphomonadaceae bacterium]
MRALMLVSASLMVLAACQPETKPASETAAAQPTPEEMGQDDPSVVFEPAPVGPPKTYEAMSKTAMSFTPGKLTVTPTPQQSINLPSGATFAFENGIRYETVMVPGGAGMGDPVYDWKGVFPNASGTVDVGDIEMYTVEAETIPPGTPNGGLCDKPFIFAVYPHIDSQGEVITIAAFTGDGWPPEKPDTALCGTFSYSAVK